MGTTENLPISITHESIIASRRARWIRCVKKVPPSSIHENRRLRRESCAVDAVGRVKRGPRLPTEARLAGLHTRELLLHETTLGEARERGKVAREGLRFAALSGAESEGVSARCSLGASRSSRSTRSRPRRHNALRDRPGHGTFPTAEGAPRTPPEASAPSEVPSFPAPNASATDRYASATDPIAENLEEMASSAGSEPSATKGIATRGLRALFARRNVT